MFREYEERIGELALAHFPYEFCCFIVGQKIVVCENIHKDPLNNFEISEQNYTKYRGRVRALVHSHPNGIVCPSWRDLQLARSLGFPCGIVSCHKKEVIDFEWLPGGDRWDLYDRPFIYGMYDCVDFVADWYRTNRGVNFPIVPRQPDITICRDYLPEMLVAHGFRAVNCTEIVAGDVFTARIRSINANHMGVYLGGEQIIHHFGGGKMIDKTKKPMEDSVYRYIKFISGWWRYG